MDFHPSCGSERFNEGIDGDQELIASSARNDEVSAADSNVPNASGLGRGVRDLASVNGVKGGERWRSISTVGEEGGDGVCTLRSQFKASGDAGEDLTTSFAGACPSSSSGGGYDDQAGVSKDAGSHSADGLCAEDQSTV